MNWLLTKGLVNRRATIQILPLLRRSTFETNFMMKNIWSPENCLETLVHELSAKICRKDFRRQPGFDLITFTSSTNYWPESLLEIIKAKIAVWCQQTFCFQKFVDNAQQCFEFTLQAKFPKRNLNFHLTRSILSPSPKYVLLDWFIHRFYPQNGICIQKYNFWPKNDGEKWF